jgi:hypothetical protein
MITIKKNIFQSELSIQEMVELIISEGILKEVNLLCTLKEPALALSATQVKWIEEFINPDYKIVHLAGDLQSGRTSMGVGMVLTTALFQDSSTSFIISSREDNIRYKHRKTLDYLRTFCEVFNLPELVTRMTKDVIELTNGSKIFFRRNTQDALRGMSLDNVFLDLNEPLTTVESIPEELMTNMICATSMKMGKIIVTLGA